jgi:hypothetical protein
MITHFLFFIFSLLGPFQQRGSQETIIPSKEGVGAIRESPRRKCLPQARATAGRPYTIHPNLAHKQHFLKSA